MFIARIRLQTYYPAIPSMCTLEYHIQTQKPVVGRTPISKGAKQPGCEHETTVFGSERRTHAGAEVASAEM